MTKKKKQYLIILRPMLFLLTQNLKYIYLLLSHLILRVGFFWSDKLVFVIPSFEREENIREKNPSEFLIDGLHK